MNAFIVPYQLNVIAEPPSLSVCKGAKADIVFLTDASWSIGDDNYRKVVKFVFNTIGAFDLINPAGIQVSLFFLSRSKKIRC